MHEFTDPTARAVVGQMLDTHPEGQSLLAEAGHRRTLAGQSRRMAADAFARVRAARLGYEALRRQLDPRYGRSVHLGVAVALLAAIAAALLALDGIEFAGVLSGWVAVAAPAAATAAWAGCAWLAALAVREERRGRVTAIAAGAAAAGLLLAALHGEAAPAGRTPGWHRYEVSVLVMLFILVLVAVAGEVITRTEPASLPQARRRWHRSWGEYLAAERVHRADAEAAAVAEQEWASLVDAFAAAYAEGAPTTGRPLDGGPPNGPTPNGHTERPHTKRHWAPGARPLARAAADVEGHAARTRGTRRLRANHLITESQLPPRPATHTRQALVETADRDPARPQLRGPTMADVLIGVVIFLAGGIAGGYLLVILGIRREERRRSMLHRQAPGLSSLAARPITGLWARQQIDGNAVPDRREDLHV